MGITSATIATKAMKAISFTSDLLAAFLAEQAARPCGKKDDHDDEGIGVAEVRRNVTSAKRLYETEKHPADDSARQIAESADHTHHKSFQPQTSAHRRFSQEDRRHQKSGYPRQHRAESERDGDSAVHGNSNQARSVDILRGCLHQDPEAGLGKE